MAKKRFLPSVLILLLIIILLLMGAYKMNIISFGGNRIVYDSSEEIVANPYIGYAPSATSTELCKDASLVYVNLLWSELEPYEGEYMWSDIEEKYHLDDWKEEGKNLVLRFVCDIPSEEEHMDIPQWLYDKTGDGEFYDIEYGKGYCPDYNNEVFIEEHEKVIKEIGRHFSGDDFLKYVELGSLGHWGEWHTYYQGGIPRMPLTDVREKYVKPYTEAFPYAKLLMRRPFAEMPEGFGVFNDMTGASHDTFVWLNWIENGGEYNETDEEDAIVAVPNIWEKAPVGGEFTSSIPISTMLNDDLDETIRMIRDSHMSFIGPMVPNVKKSGDIERQAKEVLLNMGYRYRISHFEIKKKLFDSDLDISLTMVNDGVAPIYFDHKAYMYIELPEGSDSDSYFDLCDGYGKDGTDCEKMLRFELPIDLMQLCQDETESCTITLPKRILNYVNAKIYVGIENTSTQEPEVIFDMNQPRSGKLTLLWQRQ